MAVHRQTSLIGATKDWNAFSGLPTPLRAEFLRATEQSGINHIGTHYLSFSHQGQPAGRANVIVSETDFSTFDRKLPPQCRNTVKGWYPGFMRFKVVENGFFTMVGAAHAVTDPAWLPAMLRTLDEEMACIARQEEADFLLIRDIPIDCFERYQEILRPLAYYPVLGFCNSVLPLQWNSLEDYLNTLNSKTRLKFRNSLKLKEKFDIDVEWCRDYSGLADELARLWRKVNASAQEYSREQLDAAFFRCCASGLTDNSEVLLLRRQGKLIAFMLNLFGEGDYIVLDWGVDYDFADYRDANLYRAATILSLERAIALGKKRLELGITNYTPKMTLGATIEPLVYFIRHIDKPAYSRTLAKLLADNIVQPDNTVHDAMQKVGAVIHDLPACEGRIRHAQDDFATTDIFNRVGRYYRADSMRLGGLYGLYPEFNCAQDSRISLSDQRSMVLLGTNSYLGLANDARVIHAAQAALARYGTGCSGSPLLNGTLDIHNRLEGELARFMRREAVALCSTGYQTNLAAISALCGPGDVAIMDARNHRSLFDGVKLSGADCLIYRHADMGHLEKVLARAQGRRTMVITDSLFSMEGSFADLPHICALARRYGARLFVDESHAVGVLGLEGRGVCELQGVEDQVDIVMGTFSKAFAALGGFIAGRREVIDYIKHNGGGHIFSASLPPAVVETVRTVLHIIETEPERRSRILEKAEYMATELTRIGYTARYGGSQIVPVILGNYTLALAAYKRFMDAGVYVNPVGPPAVPEEAAGFRTSYITTHRWEDLDHALTVFRRHANDLGINH